MMLFFFITGAMIEKYKPPVGHETCLTLILGITISGILWAIFPVKNVVVFKFNSGFFFNFFLPPIVFNAGFNMRKKKLFANLGNVALFGLVVTLVCFVIYSAMAYIVINHFGLMMTNYYDINYHDSEYTSTNPNASASNAGTPIVVLVQNPMPIVVPTMQILLLCALLCSSDVVSAVSIVDYKQQPKLYSCIFGEGVFNDIVSIILFNTVEQLQSVQF